MNARLLALLALTAILAGCADSGPGASSTTTTSTQPPEPTLHWLYINRTLTITGERPPNQAHPNYFLAAPGNANCVYFQKIGQAGLTAIQATADGDNPDTVAAWELEADLPNSNPHIYPTVEGDLPLTLNVTGLDVEGQSELSVVLRPTWTQPGLALQSTATLSIRLALLTPDALYIRETPSSCA
jgi:hypothetical protein